MQARNEKEEKTLAPKNEELVPESLRRQSLVLVERVGANHRDELEVLGSVFSFFSRFFFFWKKSRSRAANELLFFRLLASRFSSLNLPLFLSLSSLPLQHRPRSCSLPQ